MVIVFGVVVLPFVVVVSSVVVASLFVFFIAASGVVAVTPVEAVVAFVEVVDVFPAAVVDATNVGQFCTFTYSRRFSRLR